MDRMLAHAISAKILDGLIAILILQCFLKKCGNCQDEFTTIHKDMFYRKWFSENICKITGNHLFRVFFSILRTSAPVDVCHCKFQIFNSVISFVYLNWLSRVSNIKLQMFHSELHDLNKK